MAITHWCGTALITWMMDGSFKTRNVSPSVSNDGIQADGPRCSFLAPHTTLMFLKLMWWLFRWRTTMSSWNTRYKTPCKWTSSLRVSTIFGWRFGTKESRRYPSLSLFRNRMWVRFDTDIWSIRLISRNILTKKCLSRLSQVSAGQFVQLTDFLKRNSLVRHVCSQ